MATMSFFTLMFTDWVEDVMVKYQYGWVFVIIISVDIFINLIIILINCATRISLVCKKAKNKIQSLQKYKQMKRSLKIKYKLFEDKIIQSELTINTFALAK